MPSVSVPEKTLEHWCSQYVTYRYRSKAGLWWPAHGADIDVRFLPQVPGKAFQIELKTTHFGATYHDVIVDLGQLMRYWNGRHSSQPFYAFPHPAWSGELEPVAISSGVEPTEMAFSRSGSDWWFADWMIVLTIDDVIRVLRRAVTTHRSDHKQAGTSEETRGTVATLVRFTAPRSGTGPWVAHWGDGTYRPKVIRWRDLWTQLESCGSPTWPQLVSLPTERIRPETTQLQHGDIRAMLRRVSAESQARERAIDWGPVTWFSAQEDGSYLRTEPDDERAALGRRAMPSAEPQEQDTDVDEALAVPDSRRPHLEREESPTRSVPERRPWSDEADLMEGTTDIRQATFMPASLLH